MGSVIKALILFCMIACLISVAQAILGQATVYSPPYVPSACFGSQDRGILVSKAHSDVFGNGTACGRCYRVRCLSGTNKAIRNACIGNTVDVTVVDRCITSCAVNQLELSEEAFAKIARLELGRVNVEYEQI